MIANSFPALLQSFFTERLCRQRRAREHTLAGYRDTFRLLLRYATQRLTTTPSTLRLEDLDAPFIGQFLDHLEQDRGNSARTRNARLAAIHSFFQYVALEEPAHAWLCQRVLAMPSKRHERRQIEFLHRAEIEALLAAPDPSTSIGRRDRTLLTVAVHTGLRVSELIGLCAQDVVLGTGAHVKCLGKGRKQRATPLRAEAAALRERWLQERNGLPHDPVFPSSRSGPLSRDAIERLVAKHARTAQQRCPSLQRKIVTAHVLRHSAAMDLLQHGIDRSVIALWLGT
jgi:integrase/recombinase XerD